MIDFTDYVVIPEIIWRDIIDDLTGSNTYFFCETRRTSIQFWQPNKVIGTKMMQMSTILPHFQQGRCNKHQRKRYQIVMGHALSL